MLGQPGQQHIPPLITGRARSIIEQSQAYHGWFLVVLLKELDDQSPLRVEVLLGSNETSKLGESHRLVTYIHRVANAAQPAS